MEFTAMMDGIAESVDEVPLIETLEARCWTKAAM